MGAEHEVIGAMLERFFNNSWPPRATRHLLLAYAEVGVEQLEVFLNQPRRAAVAEAAAIARVATAKKASAAAHVNNDDYEDSGDAAVSSGVDNDNDSDDEYGITHGDRAPGTRAKQRGSRTLTEIHPEYVPYRQLDKNQSFRENFRGRAVIEYPMLHVALPKELARFTAPMLG